MIGLKDIIDKLDNIFKKKNIICAKKVPAEI
jgi:hypothetical protein